MNRNGMSYRDETHFELEQVLLDEAKMRSKKRTEEWILDERRAMLDAVNSRRAHLGKLPVPVTDVERVERQAVGHSDYAHKFALYCTELVVA
jgi:hypothetical protein